MYHCMKKYLYNYIIEDIAVEIQRDAFYPSLMKLFNPQSAQQVHKVYS